MFFEQVRWCEKTEKKNMFKWYNDVANHFSIKIKFRYSRLADEKWGLHSVTIKTAGNFFQPRTQSQFSFLINNDKQTDFPYSANISLISNNISFYHYHRLSFIAPSFLQLGMHTALECLDNVPRVCMSCVAVFQLLR